MMDDDVRRRLLDLARAALDAGVRGMAPPEPPSVHVEAFGVFVTIHHRGELRGCLGSLDCAEAIVPSLVRLAAAVARDDHRFAPLREHELAETTLDLSLLTPPAPVREIADIQVGRHGLIVQQGRRRGLLLPQVAPEHAWDRETFLAYTCIKAGLPADAWQNGAIVYSFQAEVVREDTTHGKP